MKINDVGVTTFPSADDTDIIPIARVGYNIPASVTVGQIRAGVSNSSAPTDITSTVTDTLITVGQSVSLNYTAATTVPLKVALEGGLYEVRILGHYGTPTTSTNAVLKPNNADTGANEVVWGRIYFGDSQNVSSDHNTSTNFYIGEGIVLNAIFNVYTYTDTKLIKTDTTCVNSSAYPFNTTLQHQRWDDTVTPWTSLGTLVFNEVQSGLVIIKRII